jgi:hypothetical protein
VVEARDAHRRATVGKVAYREGFTPAVNDEHVAATPRDLGLWIDSSEQTPEETVDQIVSRTADAVVP